MHTKFSFFLVVFFLISCQSDSYDIVIENGLVHDGSGSESKSIDIAIIGNQIVKVGKINSENALKVIDASGLIVSPGFIDTHAHLDPMDNFIKLSSGESIVRQGVTTSFGGPDGRGVPLKYGFKEFLDSIEKVGVGMNVGFLTGHNKIRRVVMDLDNREPSEEELERMKNLAKKQWMKVHLEYQQD